MMQAERNHARILQKQKPALNNAHEKGVARGRAGGRTAEERGGGGVSEFE